MQTVSSRMFLGTAVPCAASLKNKRQARRAVTVQASVSTAFNTKRSEEVCFVWDDALSGIRIVIMISGWYLVGILWRLWNSRCTTIPCLCQWLLLIHMNSM